MYQEIVFFKGLPGSGKTTAAKELQRKSPNTYKRINRDDLRHMLDDRKFHSKNESYILALRKYAIMLALDRGKSVILDDTNLHPKYEAEVRAIAEDRDIGFALMDLTHVTPKECIERDLTRFNSVGSKVIWKMYNQYLAEKQDPVSRERREGFPVAIICDLDGTLAQHHRSPYDYDKLMTDTLIEPVYRALNRLTSSSYGGPAIRVILLSGRPDSHRDLTEQWLSENGVAYDELFMRAAGDNREDSIVKKEIFSEDIEPNYDVMWVLDDRNRVVDMWRSLGLTCFQVNDGDF